MTEAVGALLLLLRAFSSGATAMTGVEAVSNAVPAFRPVEWRNARTALTWMVALLIAMFAGLAVTKFTEGAWVAVLAVGLFVWITLRIHRHYDAELTMLHPEAVEVPP